MKKGQKKVQEDKPVRRYMAARLKAARLNSGISRSDVAERVNRSPKTIQAYESGDAQPDADMLHKLCVIYKVGVEYMYPPTDGDSTTRLLAEVFSSMGDAKRQAVLAMMDALVG